MLNSVLLAFCDITIAYKGIVNFLELFGYVVGGNLSEIKFIIFK